MSNSLKDSLMGIGINSFFRGTGYGRSTHNYDQLKESILLHKDFPDKWFCLLDDDGKQSALEYASSNIPTIYSDGGDDWSKLIDDVSSGDVDPKDISGWYGKSSVVQAATLNPHYDWSSLFTSVIRDNDSLGYISPSIRIVIDCYSEYDGSDFYDYVFNNAKGRKWELRAQLYMALVKSGTLTPKMARKMRSDGASKASKAALESLISNISLYPDNEPLFVQFVDTAYEEVAISLAKKIPENMLTYMVGSQFHYVKRIVEDRMRAIELRKDQEESESELPF